MLLFVAALIVATVASGAWWAIDLAVGGGAASAGTSLSRSDAGEDFGPRRPGRGWGAGAIAIAVVMTVVVGAAAFLRYRFVPAHHAMYLDEPWYAEAACNLVRMGHLALCEETWSGRSCVPYEKAPGWPVLLAPAALLFGCDSALGIQVNRILGTASVLLVAAAVLGAGGRWWQAVLAAAILALLPVHVTWSATGETNVAASAIFLAGLCGALLYLRRGWRSGAALAVSGLGLATAIRPELLAPIAIVAALMARSTRGPIPRSWVAGGIVVVATMAALSALPLWTMNEAISGGGFLSLPNVGRNFATVARQSSWVHGMGFLLAVGVGMATMRRLRPVVSSAQADASAAAHFGFGGAVGSARPPAEGRAFGPVALLWSATIFAALMALAYDRFHERMLLPATLLLIALGALLLAEPRRVASIDGASAMSQRALLRATIQGLLAAAIVALVGFLWWPALLDASIPQETQLLETRIVSRIERLSMPPESLFVTEHPTILAAAGFQSVMPTVRALEDGRLEQTIASGRPVYFLSDMFCEEGFEGAASAANCAQMAERFSMSTVLEEGSGSRTYRLSRVSLR